MPKSFLVDINSTLQYLILNEDTDKDGHITVEDVGPKVSVTTHPGASHTVSECTLIQQIY